uniref:PH domain-containing protein n=1 Tax=Streptomyces sp. NBC_00049 TaxID=2903617 RepID=A0AAU2JS13_9ACTN
MAAVGETEDGNGDGIGDGDASARRRQVVRRSAVVTACGLGSLAAAQVAVSSLESDVAWWVTVPVVLLAGAAGAWGGARVGRVEGIRKAALGPGECVLSAYIVHPAGGERVPDRYSLRVTNRRLRLWDRAEELWSHPWHALRLTAEGPLVLVHHTEQGPIARLALDSELAAPEELVLAAARLRSRSRRAG